LTLNLPRTSRQHPQLSAAAHYHGLVDYNKTVTAIYTNGTVRIQKGKIKERVNIRRLFPYFEDTNH
jgi:hypothetical protein